MTTDARTVRVVRYPDAADFLVAAERWLLEREIENNVVLGLATAIAAGERIPKQAAYLAVALDERSEVAACAIRTPPHKLVVTRGTDEALDALALDCRIAFPDLPAVSGPEPFARIFAQQWSGSPSVPLQPGRRQRLYVLDALVPPEPSPPGRLRPATENDRALAIEWLNAFCDEALPNEPRDAPGSVDGWLKLKRLRVWETEEPVSILTVSGRTANGARIGMVYTPPQQRGHGYASAAVAALSAELLAGGCRYCCLYTDLANPISNRIYQRLGYRPYCDISDYELAAS